MYDIKIEWQRMVAQCPVCPAGLASLTIVVSGFIGVLQVILGIKIAMFTLTYRVDDYSVAL